MFRIDTNSVSSLPTPAAVGTPGYFSDGDPGTGTAATIVSQDWLNTVQEELVTILTFAGVTPSKTTNNQLVTALQKITRARLIGDLNLYVSSSGSDSNTGLSSGSPFATLQGAWNYILTWLDLANHSVIVNIADGTYTAPLLASGTPVGMGTGSSVKFIGNVGSPSSVVLGVTNSYCVYATLGAAIVLSGITFEATGTPADFNANGYGIVAGLAGTIFLDRVSFGACSAAHMIGTGGVIQAGGNPYSIVAGSGSHMQTGPGGLVGTSLSTVTITGTPTFTQYAAAEGGYIACDGMTFVGSISGLQYLAILNGIINTNTSGSTSYLPGTNAGSTLATGGVFN